jgi:hypothetical protein
VPANQPPSPAWPARRELPPAVASASPRTARSRSSRTARTSRPARHALRMPRRTRGRVAGSPRPSRGSRDRSSTRDARSSSRATSSAARPSRKTPQNGRLGGRGSVHALRCRARLRGVGLEPPISLSSGNQAGNQAPRANSAAASSRPPRPEALTLRRRRESAQLRGQLQRDRGHARRLATSGQRQPLGCRWS